MKRKLVQASLLALAIALSGVAVAKKKAADDTDSGAGASAVATVNGKGIPKSHSDLMIAAAKAQGRPESDELKKAVRENLINLELLSQEAKKRGFDRHAEVQLNQQQVLANAYVGDYVRSHPIPDEMIRKNYDMFRAASGDKEYKARHILVEKEDEAKDIIARLHKGEKFEDLAKASKDPGSKDKGGDLEWAVPSNYVKPFAEALVKLEKGKITETPVQSPFGWHVIRLEDTRQYNPPSLEDVKPQITQRLQQQLVQQHIQELRGKAKVE